MSEFERIRRELEDWSQPAGVSPSTLLQLAEPLRSILKRIMREGSMRFAELREQLGLGETEAAAIAELLVARGLLTRGESDPDAEAVFRLRRGRPHRPAAPRAIWDRLLDDEGDGDS